MLGNGCSTAPQGHLCFCSVLSTGLSTLLSTEVVSSESILHVSLLPVSLAERLLLFAVSPLYRSLLCVSAESSKTPVRSFRFRFRFLFRLLGTGRAGAPANAEAELSLCLAVSHPGHCREHRLSCPKLNEITLSSSGF